MTEVKTLTFAIIHFIVAFTVTYIITGSVALGGLIALIEPFCNTAAFYLHEKAWNFIRNKKFERQIIPNHREEYAV